MSHVTLGTTLDSGQTILLLSVFPQERPPVLIPVTSELCPPEDVEVLGRGDCDLV